jgi:hypothetical protein
LLELRPAARIAEADDLPLIERQAVLADRLAGPGTDAVDAIFKLEIVGQ